MTKEEIIKTVARASGAYTPHQIFRDWIECLALSVANASMVHHDEVWERHEEIFTAVMKKYDSKMLETFAQMTGGLIDLYESGFDDFLGDIYMKAGCGSGVLGQFFHTVPSFGVDGRNGGSGGCFRKQHLHSERAVLRWRCFDRGSRPGITSARHQLSEVHESCCTRPRLDGRIYDIYRVQFLRNRCHCSSGRHADRTIYQRLPGRTHLENTEKSRLLNLGGWHEARHVSL